ALAAEIHATHIYYLRWAIEDSGLKESTDNDVNTNIDFLPNTEALLKTLGVSNLCAAEWIGDSGEIKEVDQLLKWVASKEPDIFVMLRLSGSLPHSHPLVKIAHEAPYHVFLVPENGTFYPFGTIIFPLDFSTHSDQVLKVLTPFQEIVRIWALHIYRVPSGYQYIGKTEEEAEAQMNVLSHENYETFLSRWENYSSRMIEALVREEGDDPAKAILAYVQHQPADLLVMGSRGMTPAAAAVLGSSAETVVRELDTLPLLLIKIPGEKISLLDALLS
ncbi:MAG: hypothetical protein EBS07_07560, partial [Sphingobacteriia bacterium]|nr:hypothetical protein [Sphingobacteriia bacterium]